MRGLPGFDADRTPAPPVRPARGQPVSGSPETVTGAQSIASLNALSTLAVRHRGHPLFVYSELECPPGMRPALVKECAEWLPEYECRDLGSGQFECYVKKWHCLEYRQVWGCAPIKLSVFKG